MGTVGEENERRKKEKGAFPTGGDEATNPENMEALCAYIRSRGMEEEDKITFPYWKGVGEYRDLVNPNSLYAIKLP